MSRTDEDWCEDYAELEARLTTSQTAAKAWKAFARRCRNMVVKEMVEMQDTHRMLQGIMNNAKRNPGLLLAALVLEAAQDGVELGNRASECMGWAFEHYLNNHPEGPNYLEVTLEGGDHKPIYVTVQRPGGKTPHQLRQLAEGQLAMCEEANREALILRDQLLDQIEELKESVCPDPSCNTNNPRT